MDRLAAEVDGDRELPRRHFEQRGGRRAEFFVSHEFLHAKRRGHDDETQRGDARASLHREFRAQRHDPGEETQEDVGVDAAFVRLVDDDHAVLAEEQIRLNLPKQDTVRHELDARLVPDALIVTHLVPDVAAQGNVQLRGDARGGGRHRHAPRLRHGHRAGVRRAVGVAVPGFVQKLRHLRRLAAPGLAADDHDGIRVDGVHDIVLRTENRKTLAHLLYVVQAGHGHGARRADEHPGNFAAAAAVAASFAAASCAAASFGSIAAAAAAGPSASTAASAACSGSRGESARRERARARARV